MQRETIHYEADGLSMQGQLFLPERGGPRGAVLVFPEAFGIGPNSIGRAERLAELGYVALACDLHGEGRFIDALPDAMAALQGLFDDPQRTRVRAVAAMEVLAARPEVDATRVAAIGFCFPMPLELARSGADLKATIGFHIGLKTKLPATPGSIRGAMLACIGGDDPHIPTADRTAFEAEMRAAGADWQLNVYGNTVHSFTNPDAARQARPDEIRYNAVSDVRAWQAMATLLAQAVG